MQSVAAYFDVEDASELCWAHRVHNFAKLEAALADEAVQVLVGSVHYGENDATPLVADAGDVAEMDMATLVAAAERVGKAVKLDFQTPAAIEPALAILRMMKPSVPVILHAEIFTLVGSGQAQAGGADGMEPEEFIRLCQHSSPTAVLSLGWSLKRTHDADGRVEEALIQQVAMMLMKKLGPVNYGLEIRAGYTPGAFGGKAEHGAALIFDPLPPTLPTAAGHGDNVVSLVSRERRVA